MITAANVILWGTHIGTVYITDEDPIARFEYDRSFLESGIEVSPLLMPLSRRVYSFPDLAEHSFHGLPGLLSDSLPDRFGNALINAWLRSQGRDPDSFSAVERLCYIGKRGMGALEYEPATGPADSPSDPIYIDQLVRLASDILTKREDWHIKNDDQAMEQIIRIGTSAGGARAKAVIAWNETTGDIRSGQIEAGTGYGYWLIKFDGVEGNRDKERPDRPQYTKVEYAYYLMACAAGIDMSECRLYQENGRYHFMTRRFDRDLSTGAKLHMQTLGALAHFDFNMAGAYSYEQAAEVMRRLYIGQDEVCQLYRRMIFNVLARNQDDHVKNISFLMDKRGIWHLSPAYDVTYAFQPGGLWTGRHQMQINGKTDLITVNDLLQAGKNMDLSRSRCLRIIDEVSSVISSWEKYADSVGITESEVSRISRSFPKI